MIKEGGYVYVTDSSWLKHNYNDIDITNTKFKVIEVAMLAVDAIEILLEVEYGWWNTTYGNGMYWWVPIIYCKEVITKPKIGGRLVP